MNNLGEKFDMNEKEEENLKKKFGQLMTRFAIVQSIIKEYDDECKAIQKEIDDLMKGVIDGKSVQ